MEGSHDGHSEESRYALMRRLEDVLGHDEAVTLIEHLPPVGWAEVATKHDLAHLEARIESLATDIRDLRGDLNRVIVSTVSAMIGISAVLIAAIKL